MQRLLISRQELQDTTSAKLLTACRRQWEAFGMTREEAQAIVETWKPDLLDRPGFLVLSRMPAKAYDAMFPLKIMPPPDEVIRAGVVFDTLPGESARLTWLPAVKTKLDKMASDLARGDCQAREAARKGLLALGELASPFVAQLAESKDPEVRAAAEEFQRVLRADKVVMPAFRKDPPAPQRGRR